MDWKGVIKTNNSREATHSKYKKEWVAIVYVKILNLEHYSKHNSNSETSIMLKSFHEGITSILKKYNIEVIDGRDDAIYGACLLPNKNSDRGNDIINASLDINGYLLLHWKFTNYRIALALQEELMVVVDINGNKKLTFANGIVKEADNLINEGTSINQVIYISPLFFDNNSDLLINKESGSHMCEPNNPYNVKYYTSNWYKKGWD